MNGTQLLMVFGIPGIGVDTNNFGQHYTVAEKFTGDLESGTSSTIAAEEYLQNERTQFIFNIKFKLTNHRMPLVQQAVNSCASF